MLIHSLVQPKYFMPMHGEFSMLKEHRDMAIRMGMDEEDVFILRNGDVLEITRRGAQRAQPVPHGNILIDGLGVGDVGNIVLRDRKHLAEDGLMVVVVAFNDETGEVISGPDLISRGFVYVRESEGLMDGAKQ
ncbi:ribonuclease J, partial [Aduncisulcus paluster]